MDNMIFERTYIDKIELSCEELSGCVSRRCRRLPIMKYVKEEVRLHLHQGAREIVKYAKEEVRLHRHRVARGRCLWIKTQTWVCPGHRATEQ